MKRFALSLAVIMTLVAAQGGAVVADNIQTLTGEYEWTHRNNKGDLRAEFTATGEKRWDVSFHFSFRGEAHVYTGTAEGSLSEGELSGKVLNDDKRRTFTFTGEFKDGEFHGTHAEIEDGKPFQTGTLKLQGVEAVS